MLRPVPTATWSRGGWKLLEKWFQTFSFCFYFQTELLCLAVINSQNSALKIRVTECQAMRFICSQEDSEYLNQHSIRQRKTPGKWPLRSTFNSWFDRSNLVYNCPLHFILINIALFMHNPNHHFYKKHTRFVTKKMSEEIKPTRPLNFLPQKIVDS